MLAQTPPMGWNSWNTFGHRINEQVIRDTADAMVEKGLRDAGYEYVVIDDCWALRDRDENGKLVADPTKFPSGMKALADYVHSKGLKFGIYSCAGYRTCADYPGSFDHEFEDAETFAEWGVDFLKYDYCNKPNLADGPLLYQRMSLALKATGREILFSACNWGRDNVETWIRSAGAHMYRSTPDINDSFVSFTDLLWSKFAKDGRTATAPAYSAPGCYDDLDMLICGMYGKGNVGMGGCTAAEYKIHFALWCLFQSPLMIGCDVTKMDDATLSLLTNKELLSINRDPECRPPIRVRLNDRPVFFKHLSGSEFLLAIFNLAEGDPEERCDGTTSKNLYDLGLTASCGYGFEGYEIFTGEKLPLTKEYINTNIPPRDCKLYRVRIKK